jgi:hypothetical protein
VPSDGEVRYSTIPVLYVYVVCTQL